MDIIKKAKNMLAVNALVYLIIGIIMILFPGFVNNFICYLIGILVTIFGVSMIINYFNGSAFAKGIMVLGILLSIFGIYILLNPESFASIIPFIAGILILVESIDKFKHSFQLKKKSYEKWWLIFISACVVFTLSLILILLPFESIKFAIRVIGVILLLDGLSDILTIRSYTKVTKKIIINK